MSKFVSHFLPKTVFDPTSRADEACLQILRTSQFWDAKIWMFAVETKNGVKLESHLSLQSHVHWVIPNSSYYHLLFIVYWYFGVQIRKHFRIACWVAENKPTHYTCLPRSLHTHQIHHEQKCSKQADGFLETVKKKPTITVFNLSFGFGLRLFVSEDAHMVKMQL